MDTNMRLEVNRIGDDASATVRIFFTPGVLPNLPADVAQEIKDFIARTEWSEVTVTSHQSETWQPEAVS